MPHRPKFTLANRRKSSVGVVSGKVSGKKNMLTMESAAEIPITKNGAGISAAILEELMLFDGYGECSVGG